MTGMLCAAVIWLLVTLMAGRLIGKRLRGLDARSEARRSPEPAVPVSDGAPDVPLVIGS